MKNDGFGKNERLQNRILEEKERTEWESEVREILQHYCVEYPSENQIDATIDMLRSYIPVQRKSYLSEKIGAILQMASREWIHMNPLFWVSNFLFFLVGFIIVFIGDGDPYFSAMCLAPIPFVLGLIEVFKSRDQGMAELEWTTKHSLQEIILSKTVIVGSFNLLLNLTFTLVFPFFLEDVWLWKLILYWMTPFTVVSAIALIISGIVRNGYGTAIIVLAVWAGISYGIIVTERSNPWLEQIHVFYYILLNIVAVSVLLHQIYRLSKSYVSPVLE